MSVVCVQNGVANERAALRLFEDVYGVCVVLPRAHLEPGVVEALRDTITGILDVGRFPHGVGPRGEKIAAAFASRDVRVGAASRHHAVEVRRSCSTISATRWKRCAVPIRTARVVHRRAWAEGAAVLAAAGIDAVTRGGRRPPG